MKVPSVAKVAAGWVSPAGVTDSVRPSAGAVSKSSSIKPLTLVQGPFACRRIRALSPNVIASGEVLSFVKAEAFSFLLMTCISPSRCIRLAPLLLMWPMLSGAWASTVSVPVSPGDPFMILWLISSASATIRVSVPKL